MLVIIVRGTVRCSADGITYIWVHSHWARRAVTNWAQRRLSSRNLFVYP